MYRLTFLFLVSVTTVLSAQTPAKSPAAKAGSGVQFSHDFKSSLETAKKENKPMIVYFSGEN